MASRQNKPAVHPHALPWVEDHVRLLAAQTIGASGVDHGEIFGFGTYLQTYAEYLRFQEGGKRAAAERRYSDLCRWARSHVTKALTSSWKKRQAAMTAAFNKAAEVAKGAAAYEKARAAHAAEFEAARAKHGVAEKRLLKKHGIPDAYR